MAAGPGSVAPCGGRGAVKPTQDVRQAPDAAEPGRPDDPRVVPAVEEYLGAQQAGHGWGGVAVLSRHPEIAAALADCLDGLEFIQTATPQLRPFSQECPSAAAAAVGDIQPEGPLGDFRIVREVGR